MSAEVVRVERSTILYIRVTPMFQLSSGRYVDSIQVRIGKPETRWQYRIFSSWGGGPICHDGWHTGLEDLRAAYPELVEMVVSALSVDLRGM